jgi:hypothetical protein
VDDGSIYLGAETASAAMIIDTYSPMLGRFSTDIIFFFGLALIVIGSIAAFAALMAICWDMWRDY